MKQEYSFKSRLMECVFKAMRIRSNTDKYFGRSFHKNVLRCKRAEQTGDYKTAYNELLALFERHLNNFKVMQSEPSNNLTLIYNIPIESIGEFGKQDNDALYATAAVYNLYKMGFPKPIEQYGWRAHYNGQFFLRTDRGHEHIGEMRIITKKEYDNPFAFHPEYKCDPFNKTEISYEHWMDFASDLYNDKFRIKYKIVNRGQWKHRHVLLECKGHYYIYCYQFSQG